MGVSKNKAQRVVAAILDELEGRSGFSGFWDDIDSDIQKEIEDKLVEITVEKSE